MEFGPMSRPRVVVACACMLLAAASFSGSTVCAATSDPEHEEKRARCVPSGLAEEIFHDVYERPASFAPSERAWLLGGDGR